jgi:3-dehydrosphinganine reductase
MTEKLGHQHVYVTGGSQGLGLSLSVLLAQKGAHISIVARNQENLDKALKEIEVSYDVICPCLRN